MPAVGAGPSKHADGEGTPQSLPAPGPASPSKRPRDPCGPCGGSDCGDRAARDPQGLASGKRSPRGREERARTRLLRPGTRAGHRAPQPPSAPQPLARPGGPTPRAVVREGAARQATQAARGPSSPDRGFVPAGSDPRPARRWLRCRRPRSPSPPPPPILSLPHRGSRWRVSGLGSVAFGWAAVTCRRGQAASFGTLGPRGRSAAQGTLGSPHRTPIYPTPTLVTCAAERPCRRDVRGREGEGHGGGRGGGRGARRPPTYRARRAPPGPCAGTACRTARSTARWWPRSRS